MKTFHNRTLFTFALVSLAAALHITPAYAGGRSGAHALMTESETQASKHQSQTESQMQVQIEALRKEVAEIKAQQSLAKGDAVTK